MKSKRVISKSRETDWEVDVLSQELILVGLFFFFLLLIVREVERLYRYGNKSDECAYGSDCSFVLLYINPESGFDKRGETVPYSWRICDVDAQTCSYLSKRGDRLLSLG